MKCPENLQEIEEWEKRLTVCYAELKQHAEKKIETKEAKSMREACHQLSEEIDIPVATVREGIRRISRRVDTLCPQKKPSRIDILYQLKHLWKVGTLKDRKEFLDWIKQN